MDATKVSAKTNVVLLVYPGGRLGRGNRLVDLEVWLLLGHAGELVQSEVGQTKEQWVGGQSAETYLAGDICGAGEIVLELRIAAVPVETEIIGQPALAQRVAKRHRVLVGLLLAAKIGKEIEFIGRIVAVVEVHIHALAETGAALSHILADQSPNGRASRTGAKTMDKTYADPGGVRF